ncbi:iron-sulfur protein [Actinoplanes lobatus]|uniref:Cytochrome bc1 complex Rieske iron-sulfur subunit n=1 Tax=Actinoplanes lobatus TaxID=113568 RepID=A0A7W7HFE3_9ACTN|nr:Rieske (2Fe-2S) protein [Actinoplanes lobatus]MBB4749556.1 Rieske Fe-S protein [Actinoplanes lobatus]GGN77970.1 iron-sulfur protein [Actinoplanes lobatus]GIE38294.1 iron-sulfur protein [Actinoplanes lobatus]
MTDVQPGTDAETQQDRPGTASSRRVVLMGAGAVGATAVLSACGTGTSGTNPNGTDFGDNPVPAGSTDAGDGGDAGGDTGGGGSGNVLVATSKVAVGSGVILDEVVVTQPTEGNYKAFSNVCTHQGCKVSEIKDGQIICKCHNSLFSIKDGAPTSGPAGQPLAAVAIDVDGDNVVTSA